MKQSNIHDRRYKKLFSNHVILRELLESFVHEDFIRELDFSSLERLDKSFVTDKFEQKESDIIFRIDYQNSEMYIFLLIEFQSTVDKYMSLRMLRYICEFYEFLVQQKVKKLPPVFPVLLYNGDARWTAKYNLKELVNPVIPEKYIPDFSYYPVLENEISKDTLLKIKNVVSAIFYIETSNVEYIRKNVHKIKELIMTENPEVIKLFRNWLSNFFNYQEKEIDDSIADLEETHEMFATALKKHDAELKKTSEQKGKEEGLLEGKIEAAERMHQKGFSLEEIKDITGLSEKILAERGIR